MVYGEPAIGLAINRRVSLTAEKSNNGNTRINNQRLSHYKHKYLIRAMEVVGCPHSLDIRTQSCLPSSAGLGSSAAITNVTTGMCHALKNSFTEMNIARDSFQVEYDIMGRASPLDTSTVAHGSAVLVDCKKGDNFLWKMERQDQEWFVHHVEVPKMSLVVGCTGIKGKTKELVDRVYRFQSHSGFAKDIIKEIGDITREGARALARNDLVRLGELMDKDHKLLCILGVTTPELEKLLSAARPSSYGAKLTGAGGGGCIIALTETPDKVCSAIQRIGGTAISVLASTLGTRQDTSSGEEFNQDAS